MAAPVRSSFAGVLLCWAVSKSLSPPHEKSTGLTVEILISPHASQNLFEKGTSCFKNKTLPILGHGPAVRGLRHAAAEDREG